MMLARALRPWLEGPRLAYCALGSLLALAALALLLPLLPRAGSPAQAPAERALGYYARSKSAGVVRVIHISGPSFISPASGMAQAQPSQMIELDMDSPPRQKPGPY